MVINSIGYIRTVDVSLIWNVKVFFVFLFLHFCLRFELEWGHQIQTCSCIRCTLTRCQDHWWSTTAFVGPASTGIPARHMIPTQPGNSLGETLCRGKTRSLTMNISHGTFRHLLSHTLHLEPVLNQPVKIQQTKARPLQDSARPCRKQSIEIKWNKCLVQSPTLTNYILHGIFLCKHSKKHPRSERKHSTLHRLNTAYDAPRLITSYMATSNSAP